jgi:hypothetical protein
MNPQQMAEFEKLVKLQKPIPSEGNPFRIIQRFYNVEVIDKDDSLLEFYNDCSKREANQIKEDAHKRGLRANMLEALSYTAEGTEIRNFADHRTIPFVVGRQDFETPTYSESKFADKLAKLHERNIRRNKSKVISRHSTGTSYVLLADLHEKAIAMYGYEIVDTFSKQKVFRGTRTEAMEFLKGKQGELTSLAIKYIGSVL